MRIKNNDAPLMWIARISHPLLISREILITLWNASSIADV